VAVGHDSENLKIEGSLAPRDVNIFLLMFMFDQALGDPLFNSCGTMEQQTDEEIR
jgi:hypothetical protein